MKEFIELLKFCFADYNSGWYTILVLIIILHGIKGIIKEIRKGFKRTE